jgi:hypothetical protein
LLDIENPNKIDSLSLTTDQAYHGTPLKLRIRHGSSLFNNIICFFLFTDDLAYHVPLQLSPGQMLRMRNGCTPVVGMLKYG